MGGEGVIHTISNMTLFEMKKMNPILSPFYKYLANLTAKTGKYTKD